MTHSEGSTYLMRALRRLVNEFPESHKLTRQEPLKVAVDRVEKLADDLVQQ